MFYWQVVLGIGDWGVPSLSGWRELEQGRILCRKGASASAIGRRREMHQMHKKCINSCCYMSDHKKIKNSSLPLAASGSGIGKRGTQGVILPWVAPLA